MSEFKDVQTTIREALEAKIAQHRVELDVTLMETTAEYPYLPIEDFKPVYDLSIVEYNG